MADNTALIAYAATKATAKDATKALQSAESDAFRYLPTFVSGKVFDSIVTELRSLDDTLPGLLAPSAPTLSRNVCVGKVMEATDADDVKAAKSLVNRFSKLGLGLAEIGSIASTFTGTLDDLSEHLASKVTVDDELDALMDKRRTLISQIRKIDLRVKALEAGKSETVF